MTQFDRDELSADIIDGLLTGHEMSADAADMARDYDRIRSVLLDADYAALDEPPDDLWASIVGAVALERHRPVALSVVRTDSDEPAAEMSATGVPDIGNNVIALSSRARWRPIAAAAAILALAGGIVVVANNVSDGPAREVASGPVVLRTAPLNRLTGDTGEGSVKLVKVNGETHVVLTTAKMPVPPSGHFFELWLLHNDGTPATSLGVMDGSTGAPKDLEVIVPAGIDPATAPLVDISLQADGSNHVHSGESLFRGSLA